jgi:hypothetical protein
VNFIKNVPVLRAIDRHYRQIMRPAPLQEFNDYDEYWETRVRDGRQEFGLDRHRTIGRLLPQGSFCP